MQDDYLKIDKSDQAGPPVYVQLINAIQERIERGLLKAGALVPSERNVASQNDISVATVRRAYEELVQSGFLKRIQGKGTYVTRTADRRRKIRYYPLVEGFDQDPPFMYGKLVGLSTTKGDPKILHYLDCKNDPELYEVKRVLTRSDKPLVYCISYLPKKMFSGLENCDQTLFEKYAFYIFLEEKFGVSTINHNELIGICPASKDVAQQLDIEESHPLLEIEKIIYTHKNKPYEYRKSYCLADDVRLNRFY